MDDAKQIIRNLLDHAVQDHERSDECIAAVAAAREFLSRRSIFDELIEEIEEAEREHDEGHPVEALIRLGMARARLNLHLDQASH